MGWLWYVPLGALGILYLTAVIYNLAITIMVGEESLIEIREKFKDKDYVMLSIFMLIAVSLFTLLTCFALLGFFTSDWFSELY